MKEASIQNIPPFKIGFTKHFPGALTRGGSMPREIALYPKHEKAYLRPITTSNWHTCRTDIDYAANGIFTSRKNFNTKYMVMPKRINSDEDVINLDKSWGTLGAITRKKKRIMFISVFLFLFSLSSLLDSRSLAS